MSSRSAPRRAQPVEGAVLSLWRAIIVYRIVTVLLAGYLIIRWRHLYAEPGVAFAVGAAMLGVTAAIAYLGVKGRANRPDLIAADLAITIGLTLATRWAQRPSQFHGSMQTLTTVWAAGPVIEAGVVLGTVAGICAGALQFATTVIVRGNAHDGRTLLNGVLLVVVGGLAGYIMALTVRSERDRMSTAAELARAAERERLTRSIHDGVLQVLGLVHRRGLAAGGEWAELAHEAAAQEANLRALITSSTSAAPGLNTANLAADLSALRAASVNVAVPETAVLVPAALASEVLAVVRASLQNVVQHAGDDATAWIFLDALPNEINVTIRDDGTGIPPGRLAEAEAEGRLGIAKSIRGRIADLGGIVTITSAPAAGTEVEITVPSHHGAAHD